jgi:hypothetical protein
MHSNAGVRSDLFQRPLDETLLTDFFGGVSQVELSDQVLSGTTTTSEDEGAGVAEDASESGRRRRRRQGVGVNEGGEESSGMYGPRTLVTAALLAALQIGAVWFARSRRSAV